MAREYFCAYHSLLEGLKPFSDAECGRLFRACLKYSMDGTEAELNGNERFIWPMMRNMIDRDVESYSERCKTNRLNGEKGGRPKNQTVISETEKTQEKEEEKEEDKEKEKEDSPSEREKAPAHKYGDYGWIRLTDEQYQRLLKDLGEEELQRCITYIDESAQRTGNKNKWKDWNLTIRKCSREQWGIRQNGFAGRNAPHVETPGERTNIDMGKLGMVQSLFG